MPKIEFIPAQCRKKKAANHLPVTRGQGHANSRRTLGGGHTLLLTPDHHQRPITNLISMFKFKTIVKLL